MIRKNFVVSLLIAMLMSFNVLFSQTAYDEDSYNGFSTRSFMKFNSFLTVPTFSLLYKKDKTLEAIVRNSNIQFEDASQFYLLSYSGKMRSNVGAGISVFQQEVGVFKDFGALANYAYQLDLSARTKLTFGFNFFYSRRGLNQQDVLSLSDDGVVNNYQDIPVVLFQPAITVSYAGIDAGIFIENLADFNLKKSEFITPFSDKTISLHAGYKYDFEGLSGFLAKASVRGLIIARRSKDDGFTYGGSLLANLPKAGWIKAGYDNLYGLNAGCGVNLSERLSIGFGYEHNTNLGGTNEVGLIYNLGRSRRYRTSDETKKPKVEIMLPSDEDPEPTQDPIQRREEEYEDPEHNDISDEVRIAQDSINKLNKKVNEILELLKNQPKPQVQVIKETKTTVITKEEPRDTTLKRSSAKPWRQKTTTRRGGAGVMYYVAIDQFKEKRKALAAMKVYDRTYKRKKIRTRYVQDPKSKFYYVYIDRYGRRKDAEDKVEEVNGGRTVGREDDQNSDLDIKVEKSKSASDPVYVVKLDLGAKGELIRTNKRQAAAKVKTMQKIGDLETGYYIVANVFSKKAYADKFLDELLNDDIDAGYFINPVTGFRHVYIFKTNDRAEAIRLYKNNLNGVYYNKKNIIYIKE